MSCQNHPNIYIKHTYIQAHTHTRDKSQIASNANSGQTVWCKKCRYTFVFPLLSRCLKGWCESEAMCNLTYLLLSSLWGWPTRCQFCLPTPSNTSHVKDQPSLFIQVVYLCQALGFITELVRSFKMVHNLISYFAASGKWKEKRTRSQVSYLNIMFVKNRLLQSGPGTVLTWALGIFS